MPPTNSNPPQNVPGDDGENQNKPGGSGNGSGENGNQNETDLFQVVNEISGRQYKNDEEAIKGIKETYGSVTKFGNFQKNLKAVMERHSVDEPGALALLDSFAQSGGGKPKPGESGGQEPSAIEKQIKGLQDQLAGITESSWFAAHPEFAPYKTLVKAMKTQLGKETLDETVAEKEFQDLFGKVKSNDDSTGKKSVIHSKPRLGKSGDEDYQKDFDTAQKTGNWADFIAKHKKVKLPGSEE